MGRVDEAQLIVITVIISYRETTVTSGEATNFKYSYNYRASVLFLLFSFKHFIALKLAICAVHLQWHIFRCDSSPRHTSGANTNLSRKKATRHKVYFRNLR